eukprot:g28160.t1
MGSAWDIDSRYSSWRSDCYLGWLSAHLSDTICSLHGALLEDEESRRTWSQKWTKTQLELEGLFFYDPWRNRLAQTCRMDMPPRLLNTPSGHCHSVVG